MSDETELQPDVLRGDVSAFGVSDDLKEVQIQLGGEGSFLRMPSANVGPFIDALGQLLAHLVHVGAVKAKPEGVAQNIGSWKVARSTLVGADKLTILIFDEGTPTQVALLLSDIDALRLADGIEQQVFHRMSMDDQRAMIKKVEDARPGKSQIIIPPGRH